MEPPNAYSLGAAIHLRLSPMHVQHEMIYQLWRMQANPGCAVHYTLLLTQQR